MTLLISNSAWTRFNEAAGIPRGRLALAVGQYTHAVLQ